MSAFEDALRAYRAALTGAMVDVGERERGLFEHLVKSSDDIEERYRQTSDPKMCRILIEAETHILNSHVFAGPNISEARRAYAKLVETVTPRSNDT